LAVNVPLAIAPPLGGSPRSITPAQWITVGQAAGNCATCHPSDPPAWTYDNCHPPGEMSEEHADKDIFNIGGRCLECYATGQEGDAPVTPLAPAWLPLLKFAGREP
jgi:hypothetical protein